ncbi:hypothetical protein M9H77_31260 [Catharanthus roseus]|uniref:Uncharacterized protein n=1 Tax=Catharanthus roseus TaxID=4058 RepID=A0ACB9ZZI6_CATRO|nr:hypothetical protein M9H77_31260 [Catharanthus roseus]
MGFPSRSRRPSRHVVLITSVKIVIIMNSSTILPWTGGESDLEMDLDRLGDLLLALVQVDQHQITSKLSSPQLLETSYYLLLAILITPQPNTLRSLSQFRICIHKATSRCRSNLPEQCKMQKFINHNKHQATVC